MGRKRRAFVDYSKYVRRDYCKVVRLMKEIAREKRMTMSSIGEVNRHEERCLIYKLQTAQPGKCGFAVFLGAGIHGDEYEGVFSVLELLRKEKNLLGMFDLTAIPLMNPFAYIEGRRCLEKNMNRELKRRKSAPELAKILMSAIPPSDLVIDVHSSDEDDGFCCFETRRRRKSLGKKVVVNMKKRGYKIDTNTEGKRNLGGVLKTVKNQGSVEEFGFRRGADWSLTLEVSSNCSSINERIEEGTVALGVCLEEFLRLKRR